jgi:integrase
MRGTIKKRYPGSYSLIFDAGVTIDPTTGVAKRKRKWVTFRGTRKEAEAKLNELVNAAENGTLVESTKITLGEWLTEWLEAAVKPHRRPTTYDRYKNILDLHVLPAPIAGIRLRELRGTHLEAYYAHAMAPVADGGKGLQSSTVAVHHAILHKALRRAKKQNLVAANVAAELDEKPKRRAAGRHLTDAQIHCWTADEARAFLAASRAAGVQPAAFYGLALDSGMRKGELCGVRWSDLDLDAGKVRVVQQLLQPGAEPVFGPTKTGKPRTISLGAETIDLLRRHKQHQAGLKMANRKVYRDFGLVFAKEWTDARSRRDTIGEPLQANNLGQREYAALIKAADVRRIKFHGLRHTCATLLLRAGEPVHVVSERLGHSKVQMTLDTYAHVLPDMQQRAAETLSAVLHG